MNTNELNAIHAFRLGLISFMQMLECWRTNSPPVVLGEKKV